ncbi:NADPH:quinone reductase [Bdellovibrio bacteriovorus]|uniref:NADPH:quinone reductase n=1 Tax=Bdellovibrio bacteriovorus TaxID=959 RepID=A0A150WMU0_BDEBC|nr:NADP-dependent oxidoreductase [Bdellovibrio bacteriovorus]KYG65708.1 NADPH:quinone reductase [Bdellovibrio bacteriovorus]
MIAAYIEKYGHEEKLKIGDFPMPTVGPQDVLVKIKSASVNPIDFKVRDGKVRFIRQEKFPLILGHDCSGEVIQIGSQVKKFKIGDRVFSRPRTERIGTFAEFIAIDESDVALMPANIGFHEAASIPLVGLTSWQAMYGVAHLKPGQKVLIQAGSGGIGTFAIQLAKHIGAEVWTTTSTKNVDFVKSLGADHVIDYKKQNFTEVVQDLDMIFDTLGGDSLEKDFSVIKPGGFIVSLSGSPDHRTGQELQLGFIKTLILGVVGLKANLKAKAAQAHYRFIFMKSNGEQLMQISNLIMQGKIKPTVDRVFSLKDCQEAIEYSESGRARGKIVIQVSE